MASRGEADFAHMPRLGAWLYDQLMRGRSLEAHYADIAQDLHAQGARGRLLDIGTGPGRLLVALHRLDPDLVLSGLDISAAMVARAQRNLGPIPADIRCGSIRETPYEDGAFDVVTCSGSFYLWDEPERCLEEVHRILRDDGVAHLYESTRDYDPSAFEAALGDNLAGEGLIRRVIGGHFVRRQLRMTYSTGEIASILERTPFDDSFTLEPIVLARLPVWLRITLRKRPTGT